MSDVVLSITLWWIKGDTRRRIRIKKQSKTKRNKQNKSKRNNTKK
jgi:hypothetical protein